MPLPDYLKSRLTRLWARTIEPFRPSTLTTIVILAAVVGVGAYYQFNPPMALKDLPAGQFADQMRIQAASLRPPSNQATARQAYDQLLQGLDALYQADQRGDDIPPVLADVAARAARFARLSGRDEARKLASSVEERARAAGLPVPSKPLN